MSARDRCPTSIDETLALLTGAGYVADRPLATVLFLALRLGRPLFLEGEAGVGKTEIAKVLSVALGRRLIRLQCYEGLDVATAVYEWNYAAQMMAIRARRGERRCRPRRSSRATSSPSASSSGVRCSRRSSPTRPARRCCSSTSSTAPTRRSRPFSSRCSPTTRSPSPSSAPFAPSSRRSSSSPPTAPARSTTRSKRRCLYHWIDYPDAARELAIVKARAPDAPDRLSREVVAFVQPLRREELFKAPGVAETLDWATALVELDAVALDPALVSDTLGVLLKYQDDIQRCRAQGEGAARRRARR